MNVGHTDVEVIFERQEKDQAVNSPAPRSVDKGKLDIYRASFYGTDSGDIPLGHHMADADVTQSRKQEVATLSMNKVTPGKVGECDLADHDSTL